MPVPRVPDSLECLDICDETNDRCESPGGTPCTSDGRPCTADVCDAGVCTHPNQDVACDDGVFCNGPDVCAAGECDIHEGDPCTSGGECSDVCNETTNTCWTDAGVACASDGNVCTDDACSGSGWCAHDPYARFQSFATHVVRKDGTDNDRFGLKSTARTADITVAPTVSGLRLEIVDLSGTVLFSSELPAGSFVDVKGDGSLYRFRDKNGSIASANGIFGAVVKRNSSRGLVSVVMKGRNREVPELANSGTISPAPSWGSVPGSGPCLGASYVPCRTRGASTTCHS